jgi:hypothetical protein
MPLTMQDSSNLVDMLRSSPKKPAATMDGNLFVLAAQKAGLPDDMTTLNKIVDLVNKGTPVDQAAMMVAKSQQGASNATR